MKLLSDINNLHLLLFIVLPGFISTKVWQLLVPTQNVQLKDKLFDAVFYSSINFFLFFFLIIWFPDKSMLLKIVVQILVLIVGPVLWPFIWKKILYSQRLRGKILHPIPKSWDYFFGLRKPCFALIHLKNERLIGGYYNKDSYASSYPENEDLYINEVWKIDDDGKFVERIQDTAGMLIKIDSIEYIEFFDPSYEGEQSDD